MWSLFYTLYRLFLIDHWSFIQTQTIGTTKKMKMKIHSFFISFKYFYDKWSWIPDQSYPVTYHGQHWSFIHTQTIGTTKKVKIHSFFISFKYFYSSLCVWKHIPSSSVLNIFMTNDHGSQTRVIPLLITVSIEVLFTPKQLVLQRKWKYIPSSSVLNIFTHLSACVQPAQMIMDLRPPTFKI